MSPLECDLQAQCLRTLPRDCIVWKDVISSFSRFFYSGA